MTYSTSEPVALHNAIMNLPSQASDDMDVRAKIAYNAGHKDARHAAAELVAASELPLDTQLKIAFAEMWMALYGADRSTSAPHKADWCHYQYVDGTRTTDLLTEMKRVTQSLRGEA